MYIVLSSHVAGNVRGGPIAAGFEVFQPLTDRLVHFLSLAYDLPLTSELGDRFRFTRLKLLLGETVKAVELLKGYGHVATTDFRSDKWLQGADQTNSILIDPAPSFQNGAPRVHQHASTVITD
jgi:hypothetical protein